MFSSHYMFSKLIAFWGRAEINSKVHINSKYMQIKVVFFAQTNFAQKHLRSLV